MTLCVSKALPGLRPAEQGMFIKVNSMLENLEKFEESVKCSTVDEATLAGAAPA